VCCVMLCCLVLCGIERYCIAQYSIVLSYLLPVASSCWRACCAVRLDMMRSRGSPGSILGNHHRALHCRLYMENTQKYSECEINHLKKSTTSAMNLILCGPASMLVTEL
jgi:hypothetical protein